MEVEVEIRSIVDNVEEIEEKLNGFPLLGVKQQTDEYFLHPSRNFYAKPEQLREYLRIRNTEGKLSFEYHKAHLKKGIKTHSEEFVVGIEDTGKIREILLELGFKPLVVVKKTRKMFDCKDFEACLDNIAGLGTFLEIEAKKDLGGVEKTKQKCIDFLKQNGIEYKPSPEKGYPDMVIESNQNRA